MRKLSMVGLLTLAAACTTKTGQDASYFVPNETLYLTNKISITTGDLASGIAALGLVLLVYDPLAPNWEIKESRIGGDTFHYELTMKRYHTGGEGEAIRVLRRRAAQLQQKVGYVAFEIVGFREGIESQTLGARRVAEAEVRYARPPEPVLKAAAAAEPPVNLKPAVTSVSAGQGKTEHGVKAGLKQGL